jgi:sulfoacetaldehyde dehydrogenase
MRQCDLVVATGSQANVRAAYAGGTPAFGSARQRHRDRRQRRRQRAAIRGRSTTRPAARRNNLVVIDAVYEALVAALQLRGAARIDAAQGDPAAAVAQGKLSPAAIGQSAATSPSAPVPWPSA